MLCNPAIALWLQSTRPVGRVAELGRLAYEITCCDSAFCDVSVCTR